MQYFSVLVKPASSLCNMRCSYCFYHDVAGARTQASYGIMEQDVMKALICRIGEFVKPPAQVSILFQGGEPTLAGLSFYKQFVSVCKQTLLPHITVHYSIQTNGLLLNKEWCAFFKENGFLVGVSLDGPEPIHDLNRLDIKGGGTFLQVKKSVSLLEQYGVDYNILCVVTKATARRCAALFSFFERLGAKHLQFIPCLDPLEEGAAHPYSLRPRQYGSFLIKAFDFWMETNRKGKELHIRSFENILLLLQGRPAEQCGAMGFCTAQFVVEADGSIYPCDFYVLDTYRCGNVKDCTITDVQKSTRLRAFMDDTVPKPVLCKSCPVYRLCGGGCKRYRSFFGKEEGYCPYQAFLLYALKRLK